MKTREGDLPSFHKTTPPLCFPTVLTFLTFFVAFYPALGGSENVSTGTASVVRPCGIQKLQRYQVIVI